MTGSLTGAYFSAAGTTKNLMEKIMPYFEQAFSLIDLTEADNREKDIQLCADDCLVVAAPVYAGQLPAVENLFGNLKGSNTPCILMATYGNRHYDDTLAQMQCRLEQQGFICIGAAAPITPHIFAPGLCDDRPTEADMAVLKTFIQAMCKKIEAHAIRAVKLPGNPNPAPKKAVSIPKEVDPETCTQCNACVKACPVGALEMDTLKCDAQKCISCMHCVTVCPVSAIHFNAEPIAQKLKTNCAVPRKVEVFTE